MKKKKSVVVLRVLLIVAAVIVVAFGVHIGITEYYARKIPHHFAWKETHRVRVV